MTNDQMEQNPLLYIAQPNGKQIQAKMQSFAVQKKEIQMAAKKQQDVKEKKIKEDVQLQEEEDSKQDKRKSFREMTIEEKLFYLTNLPSQMPTMKCEIVTNDGRIRGLIESVDDDLVKMKTFQSPYRAEIAVSTIKDIQLKGF
ncbi:hypothetical protein HNQ94_001515 [Salirhabdus euzebyi]|uniref:Spore coat protein CotO n=1 Tax=Salirhabdus euzebyi TaxID=394506 RepID=A0A841Q3V2_9BACI|nr:CotO family spore coat protein [Salirhabdus euzebyi]MBB6453067.1 hypothetical protein [Salirhabdus euzebyi]